MRIVADENMPLVRELFSSFGEVETFSGRAMSADILQDADVLLVRSVTQVNRQLLEGTPVKFVGTATIGTDHLDQSYLQQQGITYASAPGCNANAVVQYVLSALSALQPDWQNKTVGIVGCGNVGGRLYEVLTSVGVACRCYDPFLSADQMPALTTLDAVLESSIICVHTPLTKVGRFPTQHLFDRGILSKLAPETLLLNAGRGAVIDNHALLEVIDPLKLRVVLDVWENEPEINLQLLEKIEIGTPHIAGYSYDGKVAGTTMIRDALCDWLGRLPDNSEMNISKVNALSAGSLSEAVMGSYDIRQDDDRMRQALLGGHCDTATEFDRLRKEYPKRLEFQHYQCEKVKDAELAQHLLALGFSV